MSLTYSSALTGSNLTLECEGTEHTHFWLFAFVSISELSDKKIMRLKRFKEYTEHAFVPNKYHNIHSYYFTFCCIWQKILSYHFPLKSLHFFPLNKIFMVGLLLMCIKIVFVNAAFRWQIQHILQFSSYNHPCVDSHRSFPLHPSLTSVLLEKWQMGRGQRSERVVTSFFSFCSAFTFSHTHIYLAIYKETYYRLLMFL